MLLFADGAGTFRMLEDSTLRQTLSVPKCATCALAPISRGFLAGANDGFVYIFLQARARLS